MSKFAKLQLMVLLALGTSMPTLSSYADAYVVGKVEYIRVHDPAIAGGGWAPPSFWFTLSGAAMPSCPRWNGRALLVGTSKETLSLVLSAQLTGRQIGVYYVDSSPLGSVAVHM